MRLIFIDDYSLQEFSGSDIPPYAILSHTWSDEEVSFQDMQDLEVARRKKGFRKIELCCMQAKLDGWAWAWVDTCCIDKTSSVELSEAVNSMFQWYARSMVCYVYLSDWFGGGLRACRWFSRGWTLQELIAPLNTAFFDYQWQRRGTKNDLKAMLADITGVPSGILDQSEQLAEQTIGSRMHWASKRKTTREEDIAYCLLGIFDVHMPLLYGEGGSRAFFRLQEEIVKKWDDHTLFVWDFVPNLEDIYNNVIRYSVRRQQNDFYGSSSSSGYRSEGLATFLARSSIKCPRDWIPRGIMADHPSRFVLHHGFTPLGKLLQAEPPQVTSHGLRLSLHVKEAHASAFPGLRDYFRIAHALRGPWGSEDFLDEARSFEVLTRAPGAGPSHWTYMAPYLAALDCTGPEEMVEDGSGNPGASRREKEDRCAVILLLKVPRSVRSEFIVAPYFCCSVAVREVQVKWEPKDCYIRMQQDSASNSVARPAMCEVRCSQPGFGYRLKAQAWTGGYFTSFAFESKSTSPREKVIFVSCGMRQGYIFLDARLASADHGDGIPAAEEIKVGRTGIAADKGKGPEVSMYLDGLDLGEDRDDRRKVDIFSEESEVADICRYWRDQGIVGRLNWTRVLDVRSYHPGPIFQTTIEVCEGKKLSLTLNFDRTLSDGETTLSGLEVDQYTLWLSWQRELDQEAV